MTRTHGILPQSGDIRPRKRGNSNDDLIACLRQIASVREGRDDLLVFFQFTQDSIKHAIDEL